jgi:hypothetical protein
MGVYVLTSKEKVIKNVFPTNSQFINIDDFCVQKPKDIEIAYIDVTGLSEIEIKKTLTQFKKICKDAPWGIIDPKGNIDDPALYFFEGASDYIGQTFLKKSDGVNAKRIKKILSWRLDTAVKETAQVSTEKTKESEVVLFKSKNKLPPASTFPGWKKMTSGKTMPFYLLYCNLQGKTSLDTRLVENDIVKIHKRLCNYLTNIFSQGEGLLWMDSGKDCLFLFPPKAKCAEFAIESCIRAIISAPLITLETLAIPLPANFVFALHYGQINYKPPGKTGTVVSDAVNTIFHLGTKKAESGRLTFTDEIPDGSIPKTLLDCFAPTGAYEGKNIWHSRNFIYEKPWA